MPWRFCLLCRQCVGQAVHQKVFEAYFAEGKNIGLIEELLAVARACGLSPDEAREVLAQRKYRDAVDLDWERSRRRGSKAGDMIEYLRDIYFFQVVGSAMYASDTPPYFSCGLGTECPVGMPALNWTKEGFKDFTKVENDTFQRFEDNPDAVQGCERLGRTLKTALYGQWNRPDAAAKNLFVAASGQRSVVRGQ